MLLCLSTNAMAQTHTPSDTASNKLDSTALHRDSIAIDTSKVKKKKSEDFKSKITYTAKDSLTYSNDYQKAYLYGDAKVVYEDLELTAAYMEYDFINSIVYAAGVKDSVGADVGLPNFKKGSETFQSEKLTYNFKTGKALIYTIVAAQEGGFLHAEKTKREKDGSVNIKNGIYTTCDAPHPHFGIVITKGKVLPNDKIVSGPAYMEFEDVPLPLFLPFGFFPNSHKSSVSGIIMPTYGEETTRGFYLRDGGYYFAISEYYDLLLTGDVFSKGDWGLRARSNYRKNYKFSGSFDVSRYVNNFGLMGVDSGSHRFYQTYDFKINWQHAQDAKANPSERFNANVNYTSLSYDQNFDYYGAQGAQNLMTTTKSSSISYSKSWESANLAVTLGHNQNSSSKNVTFNLPSVSFNVNRFYPFRRKNPTSDLRWYENLTLTYTSELRNTFSGPESTIFTKKTLQTAQNGFRHSIPFSTNVKFLKYFNFSPSLNYNGMLYTTQINKSLDSTLDANNKKFKFARVDTIHKLSYAHGFSPTASVSFTPTIYGMFQFGPNSKITKIRHVITPTISFSFTPEIKSLVPDYYKTYKDSTGKDVTYSIYEQNIYGTPSVSKRSGTISFNLGNNLEMKVKSQKDTVTGEKKIVLIQSLMFSTSYNIYAEKNKLSNISFSGNTPLLPSLNINYNGVIDPYILNKNGRGDSTIYYWRKHKGIGRLVSAGLSFGYTFQSGASKQTQGDASKQQTKDGQPVKEPAAKADNKPKSDFDYFKIPWSLTFSYNLQYTKPGLTKEIIQGLTFSGNINLTQKWALNFSSGYDFKNKGFSSTYCGINRNLHCFVMSINFIPFGPNKYYEFRISALSTFLRDLKYEQRKDYRDYQTSRF